MNALISINTTGKTIPHKMVARFLSLSLQPLNCFQVLVFAWNKCTTTASSSTLVHNACLSNGNTTNQCILFLIASLIIT